MVVKPLAPPQEQKVSLVSSASFLVTVLFLFFKPELKIWKTHTQCERVCTQEENPIISREESRAAPLVDWDGTNDSVTGVSGKPAWCISLGKTK